MPDARFCNQCGHAVLLVPTTQSCLSCGASLSTDTTACPSCGVNHRYCPGCNDLLLSSSRVCRSCACVVGVTPGFEITPAEYQHPSMGRVNQLLRGNGAVNRAAEQISTKVGKPWYESTFSTVRSSEKQYPAVYELGAIAAQRVGLRRMPNLYIEMERGYQSATYGSEKDAFVNVGSFIPRTLNHRELLFVIGHEYGHLLANHALWMTVRTFLVGEKKDTLMSSGIINLLDINRWLESGVDALFTNWLQVADFTADRLGLLVIGDFHLARKALFLLYLKSRREADELDLDTWAEEQEAQASTISKMSQFTSSTPYLGVRLKELREFHDSPQHDLLRAKIESGCGISPEELFDEKGMLRKFAKRPAPAKIAGPQATQTEPGIDEAQIRVPTTKAIKGNCPNCRAPLTIPIAGLPRQEMAQITCTRCRHEFALNLVQILGQEHLGLTTVDTRQSPEPAVSLEASASITDPEPQDQRGKTGVSKREPVPPGTIAPPDESPTNNNPTTVKVVRGVCPGCATAFTIRFDELPAKPYIQVRCKVCEKTFSLVLGKLRLPVGKARSNNKEA
jgi:predicted Zn finger-like uncharacterized protein